MTKAKTTFMVVAGVSVGVVRDGKRKTLLPGQGEDFTGEEIVAINKAMPGALRKAINEGGRPSTPVVADVVDDADEGEVKSKPETAKEKKARLAAEAAAAADAKGEDEDEDI
jgi:hypothetical protein